MQPVGYCQNEYRAHQQPTPSKPTAVSRCLVVGGGCGGRLKAQLINMQGKKSHVPSPAASLWVPSARHTPFCRGPLHRLPHLPGMHFPLPSYSELLLIPRSDLQHQGSSKTSSHHVPVAHVAPAGIAHVLDWISIYLSGPLDCKAGKLSAWAQ